MSDEVLRNNEIEYVEQKLESLQTARLCDSTGLSIISEYGFKGDKQKVFNQLNDYYEKLKANELTDEEEEELLDRKSNYAMNLKNNESFTQKQINALQENNNGNMDVKFTQQMQMSEDAYMLKNILHETKMCKCYNNH